VCRILSDYLKNAATAPLKTVLDHRYLMSRLSLKVVYLWRHVSSTAPPFILWWSNLEILFGPLQRSSPFIGELRCQAIQTEHGPYIAERTQKAVYIVRCICVRYSKPIIFAIMRLMKWCGSRIIFIERELYKRMVLAKSKVYEYKVVKSRFNYDIFIVFVYKNSCEIIYLKKGLHILEDIPSHWQLGLMLLPPSHIF
jgi:hypothetical protein